MDDNASPAANRESVVIDDAFDIADDNSLLTLFHRHLNIFVKESVQCGLSEKGLELRYGKQSVVGIDSFDIVELLGSLFERADIAQQGQDSENKAQYHNDTHNSRDSHRQHIGCNSGKHAADQK